MIQWQAYEGAKVHSFQCTMKLGCLRRSTILYTPNGFHDSSVPKLRHFGDCIVDQLYMYCGTLMAKAHAHYLNPQKKVMNGFPCSVAVLVWCCISHAIAVAFTSFYLYLTDNPPASYQFDLPHKTEVFVQSSPCLNNKTTRFHFSF